MSAIIKGQQTVVLVNEEVSFDPESGTRYKDQTFEGTKAAIFGLGTGLEISNTPFRLGKANGAVYSLTARIAFNDPVVEDLDRYEISTESIEKSIFENAVVIQDAATFDATIGDGADTYRKRAEDAVNNEDVGPTATWQQVVRHLKNGVTGFAEDYICLRRFRKIDLTYGYAAGKFNLADGNLIYTTAQLNLPGNVAFALPTPPSAPNADYAWRWKRRGQRVEIVGQYVEQTVELLFAPWSTLLYTQSAGNLNW